MAVNKKNKKVFLGMSGGVDSSVSALILKEQGFDVTGVFIKVWQPDFFDCTWKEDRRDAMRVAVQLGIPFITINAEKEYKEAVVDYMIDEYKKGRTPNPDVMCNNSVKFGVFYKKAIEMGADFIATGHYAKRIMDNNEILLGEAVDNKKDQSYFLWNISKESLSKTLFPLGGIEKKEVRKIAKENNLFNAQKKDSQGLCFIGKVSMTEFLEHYLQLKNGDVLNTKGEKIGKHNGSLLYTIGQRHGFEITKKTPNQEKQYVISKDINKNTITVGDESDIEGGGVGNTSEIIIKNLNLLADYKKYKNTTARIRYGQPLQVCSIELLDDDKMIVIFQNEQKGVAIGQSCVLYSSGICLGGGIIENTK
jgi:tRNA-specific 2-thiouridylase